MIAVAVAAPIPAEYAHTPQSRQALITDVPEHCEGCMYRWDARARRWRRVDAVMMCPWHGGHGAR